MKFLMLMLIFFGSCGLGRAGHVEVVGQTAGFLGEQAYGLGYEFNSRHYAEVTVGKYSVEGEDNHQLNIGYTYSWWHVPWLHGISKIFCPGLYALTALGRDEYFLASPDKYPYPEYYDQTAVRFGLTLAFSHLFLWENGGLELVYQVMMLDHGLIAKYNNPNEGLEDFISSGVMLRMQF